MFEFSLYFRLAPIRILQRFLLVQLSLYLTQTLQCLKRFLLVQLSLYLTQTLQCLKVSAITT